MGETKKPLQVKMKILKTATQWHEIPKLDLANYAWMKHKPAQLTHTEKHWYIFKKNIEKVGGS